MCMVVFIINNKASNNRNQNKPLKIVQSMSKANSIALEEQCATSDAKRGMSKGAAVKAKRTMHWPVGGIECNEGSKNQFFHDLFVVFFRSMYKSYHVVSWALLFNMTSFQFCQELLGTVVMVSSDYIISLQLQQRVGELPWSSCLSCLQPKLLHQPVREQKHREERNAVVSESGFE